jgi:hypothetical protein
VALHSTRITRIAMQRTTLRIIVALSLLTMPLACDKGTDTKTEEKKDGKDAKKDDKKAEEKKAEEKKEGGW